MSKKHKSVREQQALAAQQREEVLSKVLKFSRKRFKRFDEVILRLHRNEDLGAFFTDRRIWKAHECFSRLSSGAKAADRVALKNALVYLDKHSVLLSGEAYIQAVFNAVHFRAYWRKDIFGWKPSAKKPEAQLQELVFYLFCQYPVPAFLYKAFFEKEALLFVQWFIHIGTGNRIRELLSIPIPFTQKMGHFFLQAPSRFTIPEALRWAQVKGLNGDDGLAERMAYSWLGTKPFGDEEFWEAFIRIAVAGGLFNHDKLTELIDYVREAKRENAAYSLKGRTLQSLLRQSDEWHKHILLVKGAQIWKASGIGGYEMKKKEEAVRIEELTGSKLLADEGKAMRHCVGSYVPYCVSGKTAIFSLRKYTGDFLMETLATIEVNIFNKRVVQAKAKMNNKISDEARKHLQRWAGGNGLAISPYL